MSTLMLRLFVVDLAMMASKKPVTRPSTRAKPMNRMIKSWELISRIDAIKAMILWRMTLFRFRLVFRPARVVMEVTKL